MGTRGYLGIFVLLGACALWKNPETEILSQLKACESDISQTRGVGEGEKEKLFRIQRMFFQRLTVVLEEGKTRAHVVGTLDLDGAWVAGSGREQYIRSLGFERIEFVYEGGRWRVAGGCFPQLEEVLKFLSEEEAEEGVSTLGWSIRVEREGVQISQAYERPLQEGGGVPGWRSFFLRRGPEGKLRRVDGSELP